MKVLLITQYFPPGYGGNQVVYANICKYFPPNELIVLTPKLLEDDKFDETQECKVIRSSIFSLMTAGWIWLEKSEHDKIVGRSFWHKLYAKYNLFKLLTQALLFFQCLLVAIREDANLILCGQTGDPVGSIGLGIYLLLGKPYALYTYVEEVIYKSKYALRMVLIKLVIRHARNIIVLSSFTKKELIKKGGVPKRILMNVPGVDTNRFHPDMDATQLKEVYGLKDKRVILTVGRLIERKGFDMVIRALPRVIAEIPHLLYVIIGSGEYAQKLRQLVETLNLREYVMFAGSVADDELPLFYNACDIFIMANRELKETRDTESFGLVFIEANACGKPVIGGRAGGAVDAVQDGVTGLLVNPESVEDIASALVRLLTDEDYALLLGQNGLERVRREFTWERHTVITRNTILKDVKYHVNRRTNS